MSYNGIGLKSAKGSSTSGHVQRNISDVKKGKTGASEGKLYQQRKLLEQRTNRVNKERNKGKLSTTLEKQIEEHDKKRMGELRRAELRDKLEDDHPDWTDEKIEAEIAKIIENSKPKSYSAKVNPFQTPEKKEI